MSNGSVRSRLGFGFALSVVAYLAAPSTALALRTINVETGADAIVWIAEIADLGSEQFVVTANAAGGNCRIYEIGGSTGLWDNVNIIGTANANNIYFTQATYQYTLCGVSITWRPIKHNGYYVAVRGGAGNDSISGTTGSASSVNGNAGNDWIYARTLGSSGFHSGDGDNDVMFAVTPTVLLFGGDGNDLFCLDTYYAAANFADGEGGTDTRCGNGRTGSVYNVELTSCNNACAPF